MGSRMVWRGGAGGVVQFLDNAADVPFCPSGCLRGLLPGRALQRFVEQIIDQDGVTVLKTVEIPQLQFIIVGLGMHLIETVQKTVRFRSCRLVWVRPVLGQGPPLPTTHTLMRPLVRSFLLSLALRLRGIPLRGDFWLVILAFLVRVNGRFLTVLEAVSQSSLSNSDN